MPLRDVGGRSAAVAAALSFAFPGVGQLYARRRRAAVAFAVPALVVTALAVSELAQGPGHLVGRLLDPPVASVFFVALVVLAGWRVAAVVDAWRSGRRTLKSLLLLPALVAAVVGTHGFAAINAAALVGAGQRIFSADSLLDGAPPPAPGRSAAPAAVAGEPTARPAPSQVARPPATVPPGAEDYEEEFLPEPEPHIVSGATPDFDIAAIDEQADGLLNVLLAGVDWKPGRDHRLTDTMIVVSVEPNSGTVYMFSFPRDIAGFELYDGGTYNGRLNSFASYAEKHPERYPEGGMQSLAHQLGYLLGLPIDYYAAVDIPGFESVVRTVGGVTIYNDRPIDDWYTGFKLPAGEHRLNAEQTLLYVRSRKGSSDFARARRQHVVLAAMRREMTRPERLPSLPGVVDALSDVVRTNFPRQRLADLMALAERVDDQATNSWVFKFPEWADHPPASETGGRSVMFLRMDRLEQLSLELFGEKSLYGR